MHFMLLRFNIPKSKVLEFDLALERLIKLPIYIQKFPSETSGSEATFEMVKKWDTEVLMKKDIEGAPFKNLFGAVKVLGEIQEFSIYEANEKKLSEEFTVK